MGREVDMLALLLVGCGTYQEALQDLLPGSVGDEDDCEWSAPDNSWPVAAPDACLIGEGFNEGEVILDLRMPDQYDDEVSLWQFSDRLMVLEVSTMWITSYDADERAAVIAEFGNDVVHITAMFQNSFGGTPDQDELMNWADVVGSSGPVVAADEDWAASISDEWPYLFFISPEHTVLDSQVAMSEDALRMTIQAHLD